jgi:valyl-tRNA synthetase
MGLLIDVISGVRNIRGETGLSPALNLDVVVHPADDAAKAVIEQYREMIVTLARLRSITVTDSAERPKASASAVARGATIHVLLEGVIDFAKERERMEKELGKLAKDFASIAKKLQNQDFLAKAPAEVVTKVRDQQQELLGRQQKIQSNLDKIREY